MKGLWIFGVELLAVICLCAGAMHLIFVMLPPHVTAMIVGILVTMQLVDWFVPLVRYGLQKLGGVRSDECESAWYDRE